MAQFFLKKSFVLSLIQLLDIPRFEFDPRVTS